MIGYSEHAKTRYHKRDEYTVHGWAKCNGVWLKFTYNDEKVLKKDAPHLSRCPRCWKGEK